MVEEFFHRIPFSPLEKRLPALDENFGSGDMACRVRGEKRDQLRDLLSRTRLAARKRDVSFRKYHGQMEILDFPALGGFLDLRPNRPGAHSVHPDAIFRQLKCRHFRKGDLCGF